MQPRTFTWLVAFFLSLPAFSCAPDTTLSTYQGKVLFSMVDSTNPGGSHSGVPEHLSITCALIGNKIANGEEIELVFKPHLMHHSTIMYSSDSLCAYGPQFAHLEFQDSACSRIGPLRSYNTIAHSDEIFMCDYKYFEDDGELRQRLRIEDLNQPLDMMLAYQLCNDVQGFCLNLEYKLVVDLRTIK